MKVEKEKLITFLTIFMAILCVVIAFLRFFVIVHVEVNQDSMTPTYVDGQMVWASKITPIERGNVIVFHHDDKTLIKRVVAVQGDKIYATKVGREYKLVIINGETGESMLEDYYTINGNEVDVQVMMSMGVYADYDSAENSYLVPTGKMVVLGDNRPVSNDSRSFGAVDVDSYMATIIDWKK